MATWWLRLGATAFSPEVEADESRNVAKLGRSAVIEASVVALTVISLTRLLLLLYLKRTRIPGLLVAVGRTVSIVEVVTFPVP